MTNSAMIIVDSHGLAPAIEALRRGEVVALPTDTVYGVAVLATVAGAADKVFAAKDRPRDVTLPVLVANIDQALSIADEVSQVERKLMQTFWPGALTIVLRRAPSFTADLGDETETIGVRCPASEVVRELAAIVGPLAVTSANLHKQPPCQTVSQVVDTFTGRIAVVVDGGDCTGQPSTVARVANSNGEPQLQILRQGSITQPQLRAALT